MPAVQDFALEGMKSAKTIEELDDRMMKPLLVAATCLSTNQSVLGPFSVLHNLDAETIHRQCDFQETRL
jgi:hypothetical protein